MNDSNIQVPILAPAFTLFLELGPQLDVGPLTTGGIRSHVPISGGRVDGERVSGAIVGGHGGKLLLWRSDGVCVVLLSCAVETDDGNILWVTGQGYRSREPQGDTAMTLQIEADERGPHGWLARTAFAARSDVAAGNVFEVAAIL